MFDDDVFDPMHFYNEMLAWRRGAADLDLYEIGKFIEDCGRLIRNDDIVTIGKWVFQLPRLDMNIVVEDYRGFTVYPPMDYFKEIVMLELDIVIYKIAEYWNIGLSEEEIAAKIDQEIPMGNFRGIEGIARYGIRNTTHLSNEEYRLARGWDD
jgi:hypothetical protein